jgi:hypothetical protein
MKHRDAKGFVGLRPTRGCAPGIPASIHSHLMQDGLRAARARSRSGVLERIA